MINQKLTLTPFPGNKVPKQTLTTLVGTFPSDNMNTTANSTENAARALWHFSQTFFQEFPSYFPNHNRISIWTESYGGKYGPATAAFFQKQNKKIANRTATSPSESYIIKLDTLGIINGCVDSLTQAESYPKFAFNNTYGLQAINQTVYEKATSFFGEPGGCKDLILACRGLAAKLDPTNQGNNQQVNEACRKASDFCQMQVEGAYPAFSGRGWYDIAASDKGSPYPHARALNIPLTNCRQIRSHHHSCLAT